MPVQNPKVLPIPQYREQESREKYLVTSCIDGGIKQPNDYYQKIKQEHTITLDTHSDSLV
jgi:hypothetical protein